MSPPPRELRQNDARPDAPWRDDARTTADITELPDGLFCRDLDDIPCETVYPRGEVDRYLGTGDG